MHGVASSLWSPEEATEKPISQEIYIAYPIYKIATTSRQPRSASPARALPRGFSACLQERSEADDGLAGPAPLCPRPLGPAGAVEPGRDRHVDRKLAGGEFGEYVGEGASDNLRRTRGKPADAES